LVREIVMIIRGGEALAKCLKSFGVEHVFGLPGHGNIGLIDGLIKEDIQYIMCHHVTIAGMAADARWRTNLMEEKEEELQIEGDTIRVSVAEYEIKTLRLSFSEDRESQVCNTPS
jgi:hypothetical protein